MDPRTTCRIRDAALFVAGVCLVAAAVMLADPFFRLFLTSLLEG